MNKDKTNGTPQQPSEIARVITLAQEIKGELSEMKHRMTALEEKVEARLHDTRPIWERVIGEIDRLRLGQEELRAGLEELRGGQDQLRSGLEELRAGHAELRAGHAELRAGQDELRAGQESIRAELSVFRIENNQNLKVIEKKFKHVFGDIGELRGEFDLLEERLDKIAPQA